MIRFVYFAYGSNLLTGRLRARCPSARFIGAAEAPAMALALHKIGRDGSGKATMVRGAPSDRVFGALFEIGIADRAMLDLAERGYTRIDDFSVLRPGGGRTRPVTTYVAPPEAIDPGLLPFDWYRDLIVAGARERGFPPAYIERIERLAIRPDPDRNRPTRTEALAILGADQGRPSHPGSASMDRNTTSA